MSDADQVQPVEAVKIVYVGDWKDFGDVVNTQIGEVFASDFIFRGQSRSSDSLTSSFDRRFGHLVPAQRQKTYKRLQQIFERTADRADYSLPGDTDAVLGMAQHFGLTTRMLDWTESKYIAAFFAFASLPLTFLSSLDVEKENDLNVSVFALDRRSPLWSEDTVQIVDGGLGSHNDRIRRQRGLFTINKTDCVSIEEFVAAYMSKNPADVETSPIVRFDLSATEAQRALRDLQDMRISHSELFPGLEGVARESMLVEWLGSPVGGN